MKRELSQLPSLLDGAHKVAENGFWSPSPSPSAEPLGRTSTSSATTSSSCEQDYDFEDQIAIGSEVAQFVRANSAEDVEEMDYSATVESVGNRTDIGDKTKLLDLTQNNKVLGNQKPGVTTTPLETSRYSVKPPVSQVSGRSYTVVKLEQDEQATICEPSSPAQDEIGNIKIRLHRYEAEVNETKNLITKKNSYIEHLESSQEEASEGAIAKTAEIKEMEAQRKELNKTIKSARNQKAEFLEQAKKIEASLAIQCQVRYEAKTTLKHMEDRVKELKKDLLHAEQHQKLKEEFPDESLRTIAGAIRGIPKFKAIKKERHDRSDNESDDEVECVHESWGSLDLSRATMVDFKVLHRDIETIDRRVKRESVAPVTKWDEDHYSLVGSQLGQELTAETIKCHLDALRYHSEQMGSFMAKLRGDGDRKRAADRNADKKDAEDDDTKSPQTCSQKRRRQL